MPSSAGNLHPSFRWIFTPGLPLADRQRREQRQAIQHGSNGWIRKPGQQAEWQIFPVDRRQIAGDFRLPESCHGKVLPPPVPPASQGASGHVEQSANRLGTRCSGGQPTRHQQNHQGQIDPAPEKPHRGGCSALAAVTAAEAEARGILHSEIP